MHAHEEQHIGIPHRVEDALDGRIGIDDGGSLHAVILDEAQHLHRILAALLDVDGRHVGTRTRKALEPRLRPQDHQMTVEREGGVRTDVADHLIAECDRRHEVAVHHVAVDVVRTAFFERLDRLAHAGEISRQDGRRNFNF